MPNDVPSAELAVQPRPQHNGTLRTRRSAPLNATPGPVSLTSMPLHFHTAPWPAGLKLISALGTLIIAGVGYAAYRAIPTPSGFTHYFGLGIALVFPATLILSLLFAVTGYAVDAGGLYIQRPLWRTRLPLDGLSRFWLEPTACKGSLRIFGNGGLYSFTGLYWSRKLGRFRLYATDFAQSVVLVLPDRVVVVTPATPRAFVDHLHHLFPLAHARPESLKGQGAEKGKAPG